MAIVRQELERVNGNLRLKVEEGLRFDNMARQLTQENEELKRKIKETEILVTNKYQLEVNQKSSIY